MVEERGEETRLNHRIGEEGGRVGVQDMNGIWNMKYEYKKEKRKRIESQSASKGTTLPTTTKSLNLLPRIFHSSSSSLLLFSPFYLFTPLFRLLSKNSPTSHTNNPPQSNFPAPKNLHYHHLLLPPPLPEIPLHRNNTKSKVSK